MSEGQGTPYFCFFFLKRKWNSNFIELNIGLKGSFFRRKKFGKIQQEFSSKSLLCGETASRPTEGTVNLESV